MLFSELVPDLRNDDGSWDMDLCDLVWLIVSVDSFQEHPEGQVVYLGRVNDGYCWHFEFEDTIFGFDNIAEAKAEIARADTATTVPLFLVNLADLFRFAGARLARERAEAVEHLLSKPFFRYLGDRSAWVANKRARE